MRQDMVEDVVSHNDEMERALKEPLADKSVSDLCHEFNYFYRSHELFTQEIETLTAGNHRYAQFSTVEQTLALGILTAQHAQVKSRLDALRGEMARRYA
jgi:hypothetical protein